MTWRVDVVLTDGRHRSPIIDAPSAREAIRRAWALPRWAVINVTNVRRWTDVAHAC